MKLIWISLLLICTVSASSQLKKVYGQRILRHISTRWISPCQNYGTVHQSAQILFKILGTRKGFNGKSGIAASERYIRIEKCHVMSHILLQFVIFLLKNPLFYKIFGLLDMRNHAEMSCISFCLQDSHATSSCLNV